MSASQLEWFYKYADAVNADRYRVTCVRLRADGRRDKGFVLGKREGVTDGFKRNDIEGRISEMLRLQSRGENIYYTPLSDRLHHILIDDMNREKLERLIRDGYQPAALIESSPDNFQAIITVPKLGTLRDGVVSNSLSKELNCEYGDENLSGCIHPHRAPGFENLKPKHRRADGTFPVVRLVKSAQRECAKALERSRQIDEELRLAAEASKPVRQPPTGGGGGRGCVSPPPGAGGAGLCAAYHTHFDDIRKLGSTFSDLSRFDSMIAVRLRVTGHDRDSIEATIYQCAPSIRSTDKGRDWADYAKRTANYAYSLDGDRQVDKFGKYRRRWVGIEQNCTLTR